MTTKYYERFEPCNNCNSAVYFLHSNNENIRMCKCGIIKLEKGSIAFEKVAMRIL